MFKRFCLVLSPAIGIVLLAVLPAFAQVDTAWVRSYNGPGNAADYASALAVDDSGNIYVTGASDGGATDQDYATIKYDPDGDTAWVRRYNGPGNGSDGAKAIAVDDSGNVCVTGQSYGGETDYDYATIKYDSDGDTVWVKRYDGHDYRDCATAIAVDDSGNVYVTGYAARAGGYPYNYDYVTLKYYPDGERAWTSPYVGPGNDDDQAYAIAVDDSGNVYVTGRSYDSGTDRDYATIKYYPDGDTVWVRRHNGPGNAADWAWAIAVDVSKNVYVTGASGGIGTNTDYATIKYYPNGDTAWVRRYNGPGNDWDEAYAIAADASGNVYVTGASYDSGTDGDYATIKYYSNGDTAWVRRYNGPGNADDYAWGIALDGSGNVYVTGTSRGSSTDDDWATIKYDSSGNELWAERYDGPGNHNDEALAIALDGSNNVHVTGRSRGSGGDDDYATIKYVQTSTAVEDESADVERPSEFALSQNYPNPFNPATRIEFALEKPGFVSLDIYDLLGRKVRTLVDGHLRAGYKIVDWDGKDDSGNRVSSGIYFYRLQTQGLTEAKRMLLLK